MEGRRGRSNGKRRRRAFGAFAAHSCTNPQHSACHTKWAWGLRYWVAPKVWGRLAGAAGLRALRSGYRGRPGANRRAL